MTETIVILAGCGCYCALAWLLCRVCRTEAPP